MPFLMTPEKAADYMFLHMQTDDFKVSFPTLFSWLFRAVAVPARLGLLPDLRAALILNAHRLSTIDARTSHGGRGGAPGLCATDQAR